MYVRARVCVSVRAHSGLWKRSRNQLQLFSVDNIIKLKAVANTAASDSYLERTEIYKRKQPGVHSKRKAPSETLACPAGTTPITAGEQKLPQTSPAVQNK